MDETTTHAAPEQPRDGSAFQFTGTWQEFLPIALTNLLLTIVTLGIYRFWAKARERRYLWSRTRFIDDHFEWTGTGLEMFIGFVLVMAILLPGFLFLNFGMQAMVLRGRTGLAILALLILYLGFIFLYHVAIFRALRYRLSRSWWHGIRGGSDDRGWGYGAVNLGRTLIAAFTLGLLTSWAMSRMWNQRWQAMSFGPHPFQADLHSTGLFARWLLIYIAPFVGFILLFTFALAGVGLGRGGAEPGTGALLLTFLGAMAFYVLILLASLAYYALYYRKAAEATSLAGLRFAFTAHTVDWLKLILGNIGLVIVTFGIGAIFIPYRTWSFIVRHMEVIGTLDLDSLVQSTTHAPTDAEGLADAFDLGAI